DEVSPGDVERGPGFGKTGRDAFDGVLDLVDRHLQVCRIHWSPLLRRAQLGMMTLSMAWMTPFLACMSLVVTLAPFTVIASPSSPSVKSLPDTVFTLSPSRICPTACALTLPART